MRLTTEARAIAHRKPPPLFRALWDRLVAVDAINQSVLFGSGILVTVLPFLLLLGAIGSQRIDDDIALHMGLDHRAERIVRHLFEAPQPAFGAGVVFALVVMLLGSIGMVSSLQTIYERAFDLPHRGMRDTHRFLMWIVMLCAVVAFASVVLRPAEDAPAGVVLASLVTFAIFTPFIWWTSHFLLDGRISWSELLPGAIATGVFTVVFSLFSKAYFSSTIISDSKLYGSIGAVFSLLTWMVSIALVVIIGAVVGVVWRDRAAIRAAAATAR